MKRFVIALLGAVLAGAAHAADPAQPVLPGVVVSASATQSVANDRMHAWLRVEVENSDPARAAAEVNAKIGKALARVKATPGVEVTTSGYSSYQVAEKGVLVRWRVTQSITLEGSDFGTMAALVTKLQSEDALLLSGMNFAVSRAAREKAEDALTQQAIKSWQARAQAAAQGFGSSGWRPGHVAIQTGDFVRPQPMYRASAAQAAAGAPVATEGGTSDITVTVSGEAILEPSHSAR